jgi:phosphopantetheine--protein transferase-like protein
LLVGNDVVDLGDAEARLSHLHPRFAERAFTMEERLRIFSGPNPKALLWIHWAAKESAYKVLKKADREAVFSPSRLVVELGKEQECGLLRGSVSNGRLRFDLEITRSEEWIHALALIGSRPSAAGRVLSGVQRCPSRQNPSKAVRTAAARALATGLGLEPEELSIDRSKPPRLVGPAASGEVDISLSHHGRWISFAAVLIEKPRFEVTNAHGGRGSCRQHG